MTSSYVPHRASNDAIAAILPVAAQQPTPAVVKAGVLACSVSPSIGLIVGAREALRCRFTPEGGGAQESYTGTLTQLGLDIGVTGAGELVWTVFAPTTGLSQGGLAGTYVGAEAEVSAGLGLGANVLLGGSNRTTALQPLSIESQVGINLAVGVAGMELRAAP